MTRYKFRKDILGLDYKFLLFDLDHTLLDFDRAEENALEQLFERYRVADKVAYKAAYRTINKALWRDLEAGRISKQALIDSRFARLFAHFGQLVDGAELAQAYEFYLSHQGQSYPGAVELLTHLNYCGYKLYAATNGITAIQQSRLKHSGLVDCFEAVFISEQIGFPKPDGRFFKAIAEQIDGFLPEKALMIGDNQTADIKGASDAGIATVFYNPNHVPVEPGVAPTYIVDNYTTLEAMLGLCQS